MTIVILRGGLGNQLFQIAAGLHFEDGDPGSVRIDDRFLATDKNKRAPQLETLGFRFARAGRLTHGIVRIVAHYARKTTKARRAAGNRLWAYLSDDKDESQGARLATARIRILDGYWQRYAMVDESIELVRERLRSTERLAPSAARLMAEVRARRSLAVHVRRGDYVSDPAANAVHGTCGTDYYRAAVRLIQSERTIDAIYVFSDDIGWAEENLDLGTEVVYANADRELSEAEEFRIMAACRYFIIANSTFSWWAARISDSPDKMVVAPRRWFRDPRDSAEALIPPEWHRVG